MFNLKSWHYSLLITLLAVLLFGGTARAASITGLIVFDTDSSGNRAVTRAWNTDAGGPYNLYITDTTFGGAFINWDNDANTSVNYALTPGSYQFYMYGQGTGDTDNYYGLNLFFDGDNTSPGISVFAEDNVDSADAPAYPAISANGAGNTPDLLNNGGQAGANTLVYNDGSVIVTLTDFWFSFEGVRSENRVQAYDEAPAGGDDLTGSFAVTVTAVPEPSSAMLLYFGAISIALMRRKRREACPSST